VSHLTVAFRSLPRDTQLFLEGCAKDALVPVDLSELEFTLLPLPVDAFPDVEEPADFDDRSAALDLPLGPENPAIICGGAWLAGCGQVWKARVIGEDVIHAVDLREAGIETFPGESLGALGPVFAAVV
jgi:hypothetical protein